MAEIPVLHGLLVAATLFVLGLTAVLVRRNLVFVLIGLEIMLNAAALAFVVGGARWGQADGQVMFLLALTLAGAGAAIGLALVLQVNRRYAELDVDHASEMRG